MAIRSQFRILPLFRHLSTSPETTIVSGDVNETLVSTAVSILRCRRRRSRWNFLKSILPSSAISPSESSAIILHLRNNPRLALRFFLWSRDLSLCAHNISSYCTIIHILARSRHRSAAISLLRAAIRSHPSSLPQTLALTYRSCDSAPFVFDLLIHAYLHCHDLESAINALRSLGIHPLTSTANSILRAAARLHGSPAAIDLYRELAPTFRPNSQTFSILLLSLYRDGKAELNGEIVAEMERLGCRHKPFTYSIRMAGCGEAAEARRLWEEMAAKGMKPDITAYNTLINCYCEAGEVGEAEELCREMAMAGLEVTGTTLELLIKGHCRAGSVEEAIRVCGDMRRKKGIVVEREVADEMLDEMCEKGMVDEGLGFLSGSRRSYEAVIKGFCEAGRMEEAAKLQAEMAGKGLGADARVYGAFISGYQRLGELEMAEKLRKEMLQILQGDDGR